MTERQVRQRYSRFNPLEWCIWRDVHSSGINIYAITRYTLITMLSWISSVMQQSRLPSSGDDGKVTSAALAVAGASDQGTLDKCGITAVVGEGDDAETVTVRADTTPAAAAEMLMGEVHELTWTEAPNCPNTLIYKVAGTDLADSDTTTIGASGTDVKLLVLPTAKTGVDNCTIGTTVVKFAAAAFSDTANAAAVEDDTTTPCAAAICFADDGDGTLTAWANDNDVSPGGKWIKKTGNKYVYHVVAAG